MLHVVKIEKNGEIIEEKLLRGCIIMYKEHLNDIYGKNKEFFGKAYKND